jgi:hypothetical protein
MAEKNTRWENDKEWAGWTLRDEIYAFVRAHLQPIISGAVGGAMGAIIAAIKSYPTVAASIGAVVLTLAVITILAIKDGRKRNRRAETKVTESTARLPSVLREEINFNYLPDPLTKHGWRQGYASNVIPTDAVWKAATEFPGGMSMALSDLGCAIDYPLTAGAVLSKRIVSPPYGTWNCRWSPRNVAVDRRHPKARLMDHQLAVQKSVGLRTEPQIHLKIAAAAETADNTRRDCRPEGRRI